MVNSEWGMRTGTNLSASGACIHHSSFAIHHDHFRR
jgi:hypothetical protein